MTTRRSQQVVSFTLAVLMAVATLGSVGAVAKAERRIGADNIVIAHAAATTTATAKA